MKISKARASIYLILLFHFVGLIGFLIPFLRPLFLHIVPFHLLLMLFLLLINQEELNVKFAVFTAIIMVFGFTAEWVGVHKQWLFGNYQYDEILGFKLFKIPLMIGVNWFLLIYATGVLLQKVSIKEAWIKIISGAAIMVLLDLLIEPVAIKFHYWHWLSAAIPVKNYVGWFLVSALFLTVFQLFNFKKQSWVAPVLLLVQFVFFAVLNLA